jgi:hypothetical protein
LFSLVGHRFFRSLLGSTNIDLCRSRRMQGLPPEDLEGYQPLFPNSPKGFPEGVVDHEVASEVGSTHSLERFRIVSDSLEAFHLPINPALSVSQNPHIPWMNSSGEIFVDTEVPNGPNIRSRVEDPFFQSESVRTLSHTVGTFGFGSIPLTVRDMYGNLRSSPNQPMESQVKKTYVTYMVPLDHFTSTVSNITIISDQLLIGSHSIPTLHMAHSTMVPQATTIPTRNVVISQALIGTPLPSRPNPSLPPRYRALNTSIPISS